MVAACGKQGGGWNAEKHAWRGLLLKPGRKREDNIRMDVKCMSWKGVIWISLALARDNWWKGQFKKSIESFWRTADRVVVWLVVLMRGFWRTDLRHLHFVGHHVHTAGTVQLKYDGTRWHTGGSVKWENVKRIWMPVPFTLPRNMLYAALLPLMRTPRLPVVDWTDTHWPI